MISFSARTTEVEPHNFQKDAPITNQQCIACHQQSQHDWQQSDHANAMAIADKTSVLADFDNVDIEHYGQKAKFFIKNGQYSVTISYDDKKDTYPIKYTFGHYPLQQYLVETEKGKLQVVPFAWDARNKEQGGQRWYHNYNHEEIRPEDRLHWRQPLQNWNGMCADCHSDGLVRNYNTQNSTFDSQFDNINVGCLSCHGDMSQHAKKIQPLNFFQDEISIKELTGQWLRSIGEKTASWQGKQRDNTFMDGCFACHSLRSPLTDGIDAEKSFLDQFTPQLLASPNYHADGQIKEEVYVYGSFLQSKMYDAGVNCIDCHDRHTMKIKAVGNGLCLQCHSPESFNVKSHHQHNENSQGAQCVNCHMPENRYMGVDDRRDHSFKIPRPDLSLQFNTPNACTKCHTDRSNLWANEKLKTWHGKPQAVLASKHLLMLLNSGQSISLQQHLSILADDKLDVISRATAIQLLPYSTQTLDADILATYFSHKEPLFRLSAATVATMLSPLDKIKHLTPLLKDKYKAVRVSAARNLLTSKISQESTIVFDKAFKELIDATIVSTWRGEGMLNQGVIQLEMNQLNKAEQSFIQAIKIEPYLDVSYINLADLYRAQQKSFQVNSVLFKGIKNNPKSADLHYSYGLYFVRQKKLSKAIPLFEEAMKLMPVNSQYAYTYVLAIDGTGKSSQALTKLKSLIGHYQDNTQLKELGLYIAQKTHSRADYNWFMRL